MRTATMSYGALLLGTIFFGFLFWTDSTPAYTQEDEPTLLQLTSEHSMAVDSTPAGFTELNGAAYFGLNSDRAGLWRTDGTAQGTELIKNLNALPNSFFRSGSLLYFVVTHGSDLESLWRTDGTAAGTIQLAVLQDIHFRQFASMGETLYFIASDPAEGVTLWQSNGTPEGTQQLADVYESDASHQSESFHFDLLAGDTVIYFTGAGASKENTLWISDGTAAGTRMIYALEDAIEPLVVVGDVLYFDFYGGALGTEPWRYAPGDAEPRLFMDINPGPESSYISPPVEMNGRFFFAATHRKSGVELWQSDGTVAGTRLVKDIMRGTGDSLVRELTAVGDLLYFVAGTHALGYELWKSDGTRRGTTLVADLTPGPDSSRPGSLTAMQGHLYFTTRYGADDPFAGTTASYSLWRSDGTPEGTHRLKEQGASGAIHAVNNRIYFSAEQAGVGDELWVSDGTAEGTTFIKDMDPNHIGAYVAGLTDAGNRFYYIQEDRPYDSLWVSDDTSAAPVRVAEPELPVSWVVAGENVYINGITGLTYGLWKHTGLSPTAELVKEFPGARPGNFVVMEQQLFFTASDAELTAEEKTFDLWRSDGTEAGTYMLVKGDTTSQSIRPYAVLNGRVIARYKNEIWTFDGTPDGIEHFVPTGLQGSIEYMVNGTDLVYFLVLQSPEMGRDFYTVWRTDGTQAGTQQLQADRSLWRISQITPAGNALYLVAYGEDYVRTLWYADETSQTLNVLKKFIPTKDYYPRSLTVAGDQIFFTVDDGEHGPELWRSDGTPGGTTLVKDIAPPEFVDVNWAYPGPLLVFGDRLLFGAHDGVHGKELWQTDGTAQGTSLFADINPGPYSANPTSLFSQGERFYFSADDGLYGHELWQSDGSPENTIRITDLYPGLASSNPALQMMQNDSLFFTADNGADGKQLWSLHLPGGSPATGEVAPAAPQPEEPQPEEGQPGGGQNQGGQNEGEQNEGEQNEGTSPLPPDLSNTIHLPIAPKSE